MGANMQLRTVQWATGVFGAVVKKTARPRSESVSVMWSSRLVTVENHVLVWSKKPAAGSTEIVMATTVDSTQVYNHKHRQTGWVLSCLSNLKWLNDWIGLSCQVLRSSPAWSLAGGGLSMTTMETPWSPGRWFHIILPLLQNPSEFSETAPNLRCSFKFKSWRVQ